uniref:Uncharacterized protein n=1 Tax=Plectus sambesii TaxID=2011161 RepID=A0A914XHJ1_9BILA
MGLLCIACIHDCRREKFKSAGEYDARRPSAFKFSDGDPVDAALLGEQTRRPPVVLYPSEVDVTLAQFIADANAAAAPLLSSHSNVQYGATCFVRNLLNVLSAS